ncbi:MAG: LysR substrate-binding domain-containing protein [Proteobacteria bacterium]|nr:LysR substrate-binding domain-containing protein [Pseudomonadota bacterium]
MNVTIRQLEIFLELARNPHLGRVAESIGLTQSAVSMAIKSLEDVLDKKLFDRINKKLILNEYGRMFFRKVEPIVDQLGETEVLFRDEHYFGELKLGVSSSIANYLIPQIIYGFKEKYKNVTISMATGNTQQIVALLESGKVDMGFVEGEFNSVDVIKEVLGDDELYIVTGDAELAGDKVYNIEELLPKKWVLREKGSGTREVFLHYLKDYVKEVNVFMELDHAGGVKSVLHNKDTLACLSQYCVRKELVSGLLYRINVKDIRFMRSFYTVWHRNKILSPILLEFIEMAKAYKRIGISALRNL